MTDKQVSWKVLDYDTFLKHIKCNGISSAITTEWFLTHEGHIRIPKNTKLFFGINEYGCLSTYHGDTENKNKSLEYVFNCGYATAWKKEYIGLFMVLK